MAGGWCEPPPPERRSAARRPRAVPESCSKPLAHRAAGWKHGARGAAEARARARSVPQLAFHQPAPFGRLVASEVMGLAVKPCAAAHGAPRMALCTIGASADAARGRPWLGYDSGKGPASKPPRLERATPRRMRKSVRRPARNRWSTRRAAQLSARRPPGSNSNSSRELPNRRPAPSLAAPKWSFEKSPLLPLLAGVF